MKKELYPILEFDDSREGIFEPSRYLKPIPDAEYCVITFFPEVVDKIKSEYNVKKISSLMGGLGDNPLYEIEYNNQKIAFYLSGVGAPLATFFLEQVIALGFTRFVACGGAGVLVKDIQMGKIVIPSSALRDEGVSYHYLPPGREIIIPEQNILRLSEELKEQDIEFIIGKTWTTDAPIRETRTLIQKRKAEGCITVEMECAAFAAVCQFRNVKFAQFLYGGDDVSGEKFDHRRWSKSEVREKLFWISINACLRL